MHVEQHERIGSIYVGNLRKSVLGFKMEIKAHWAQQNDRFPTAVFLAIHFRIEIVHVFR